MARSACIHPHHREAVAIALTSNGFLTQGSLAAYLDVSLSTVNNFCRGLRVSVRKFEEICEALNLDASRMTLPATATAIADDQEPATTASFFAYDLAWVGRDELVADLSAKLQADCRLLLITGIAGVGKTALAERLAIALSATSPLIRINFDHQEQTTDFSSVAARLLEQCGQVLSPEDRQNPAQLARRLLVHLQDKNRLILIDSLEVLLIGNDSGEGHFQDAAYATFFQNLLSIEALQSRLILTSQELPTQLAELGSRYHNFWHCAPLTGLSAAEQLALFEKVGFEVQSPSSDLTYLVRIGKAYEGHPLALRIITGEIGSRPFFGNVTAYWHRYGQEIEAVEQALAAAAAGELTGTDDKWALDRFTRALRRNVRQRLEQTLQRLQRDARLAYLLLCEAAVYRCPVPEDWWLTHLDYWDPNPDAQLAAIDALRDRYLVEEVLEDDEHRLKQHNLIRSVALAHLDQLDLNPLQDSTVADPDEA
ncbi:MAG: helix-turn-helix domain-containing protein [Cyanobacteria bacterium P01_H01_bin.162]